MSCFQNDILRGVDERLKVISDGLGFQSQETPCGSDLGTESVGQVPSYHNGTYTAFVYAEDGSEVSKHWQVPKSFVFPKVTRRIGWQFWLLGMPDYQEKQADGTLLSHPIMPFHLLDPKMLPVKARNTLRVNWHPVYKIMDGAFLAEPPHHMTGEEVEKWFNEGSDILKSRASYCFTMQKHNL